MFEQVNELYQKVILDHNKAPRNYRKLPEANHSAEGNNPLCGDRVSIYATIEGETIREMTFQGSGCAIAKAAASIMTETLKGKSVAEAQALFAAFQSMLKTGKADQNELGDLWVFSVVHRFPMRVKCAALPWQAMNACLTGTKAVVSTETPRP